MRQTNRQTDRLVASRFDYDSGGPENKGIIKGKDLPENIDSEGSLENRLKVGLRQDKKSHERT